MQHDVVPKGGNSRPILKPNVIPRIKVEGGQKEMRYCDVECQTDPADFTLSLGKKRKIVETSSSTNQVFVHTSSGAAIFNNSINEPIEREVYDEFDEFENYIQSEYTDHNESSLTANEKIRICELTMKLMEGDLLHYTGIPKESSYVIDLIIEKSSVSKRNLFLILRKIRHNETFKILCDLFGLSYQQAVKVFSSDIEKIAASLKPLTSPPEPSYIHWNFPQQFKHKYPYIQIILNCFEISIGNTSNPVNHSLGWSQNRYSNTIKYLIGYTPDGVIIFISKGFSGKISNNEMVRRSGFLNIVKTNTYIMAASGFNDIDSEVFSNGGTLLQHSGATAGEIYTSDDAEMYKSIAAKNTHVGSVVGKIRNFEFLKSKHALLSYKRTILIEYAITIASAICNMQELLKKI